jgi:hypothetical protein
MSNYSIFNAINKQLSLWFWDRKLSKQYNLIMKQQTKLKYSVAPSTLQHSFK